MITRVKAHVLFWATLVAGFAADFLSKHFVFSGLASRGGVQEIWTGVFRLNLRHNTGGVFSLFHGHNTPLMICSLCALCVIVYLYLGAARSGQRLTLLSLACIAAGASGNLADRFAFGSVRDFLDVYVVNYPVFNVADILITAGAVLLVIELFRSRRRPATSA